MEYAQGKEEKFMNAVSDLYGYDATVSEKVDL